MNNPNDPPISKGDGHTATDADDVKHIEAVPPWLVLVPRIYLERAYTAASGIATLAEVLNEMTAAKDCQDGLPRWWSPRHDEGLLSAIEVLAEGIQLRMEELANR